MWYAANDGGHVVLKVMLSHGVNINAKNAECVGDSLSKLITTHALVIDTKGCTNLHDACWAPPCLQHNKIGHIVDVTLDHQHNILACCLLSILCL